MQNKDPKVPDAYQMIYVHGEDVSNLNLEEVDNERNKNREILDRLSPGPFEKKYSKAYQFIADQLCMNFQDFEVDQISTDEVLTFQDTEAYQSGDHPTVSVENQYFEAMRDFPLYW